MISKAVSLVVVYVLWLIPSLALGVPFEGQSIMISGPSPYAVEVGKDIARKGGNAVDVAVAAALSLAVTHPYYGSLGGGGFALLKTQNEIKALDFREVAPKKATPDLFNGRPPEASITGGLAVGVPGIPAGLWELHKKYGRLKWSQVLQGPLHLAEKGFEVSGEWSQRTTRNLTRFNAAGKKIFAKKNGNHRLPGDRIIQPNLAALLRKLKAAGAPVFYTGDVARDIVDTVNQHGGIFSLSDLSSYRVRWHEPLTREFAGFKVHLMPPPSSGGVVIAQALRLIEKIETDEKLTLAKKEPLSADELHLLAEIMKLSYRGRSLLGDPAFAQNPIEQLLSEPNLTQLASQLKLEKTLDVEPLKLSPDESGNTTHLSVMDKNGNAVAMTITLNGDYGSGLVTPKYGIALNNEMDDFTTRPGQPNMFGLIQGDTNVVRAGARPLSSMSPTIVEKNGQTYLVLGAPGGPRIISGVFQVLYRVLTQKFDIDQAIQAPRVHHQFLPNLLIVDELKFSPETLATLRNRGHKIDFGSTGKIYSVLKQPNGILQGAFDSRGEGAAGGF